MLRPPASAPRGSTTSLAVGCVLSRHEPAAATWNTSAPPRSPTRAVLPSDDSATPEPKPAGSAAFVSFAIGAISDLQARGEGTWNTYTAARFLPTAPAATRTVAPSEEVATAVRFAMAELGRRNLAAGLGLESHEPSAGARTT